MSLYRFSPYEYDSATGQLRKYGLRVKLQQKPQIVLTTLLEEPGRTVARRELHRRLWPEGTFVDFDPGLSVAVKKLRDALSDSSDTPTFIATISGAGYRFIGEVEHVAETALSPVEARGFHTEETVQPGNISPELVGVLRQTRVSRRRFSLPWLALTLAIFATIVVVLVRSVPDLHLPGTRSLIVPPSDWKLLTTGDLSGSIALSPEGHRVTFGASHEKSGVMLFLRDLDSLRAEPLRGTEGGTMPFWSPDGRKIGFFADQKLKVLDLSKGLVSVVCPVEGSPRGGSWGVDNAILFTETTRGPILKVAASGGNPTSVTELAKSSYTTHRWPEFLPDGQHFLFLAANHDPLSSVRPAIFLGSLDMRPPRLLVESDSNALLVAGELLFVSGGKLLAQSLDTSTGTVGSAARILTDDVEYDRSIWHAAFAASPQVLLYRERPRTPESQVVSFFDNSGKIVRTASRPGIFRGASVSPDGKSIAAMCDDPDANVCLIHQDGTFTRVSDSPINFSPIWSPDGLNLVYGTHRGPHRFGLVLKDTQGQGPERILLEADSSFVPFSWATNRDELLVGLINGKGRGALAVFRFADHRCRTFLSSDFNVHDGRFSPDGKWVAYQSGENGQDAIYITSYPDPSDRYLVFGAGGHAPRWGQSGQELYFLDTSEMIHRARITDLGVRLKIKPPEPLFRPALLAAPYDSLSFDAFGQPEMFVAVTSSSQNDSGYVLATSWKQ